ncbi:MAG TPA: PAS domain S-box protein [Geobacteraceae bacterium]
MVRLRNEWGAPPDMANGDRKYTGQPQHVVLVGGGLAALYWALDAEIDSMQYGGEGFFKAFFAPHPHDLWARLLFLGFLVLFVFYVNLIIRKRDLLAEALNLATLKAEEERARSEAIIAAIGDGMSIQDTEFRVLYQNEKHKELVGGDFAGRHCYDAYACRDRVCPDCPVAMCYRDGHVHKVEKAAAARAKFPFIEITASPLRDASGKIVAGIELIRDISWHKEYEEALERQARFLQQLIDTIPSPIFYKDAAYRFMGCNAAFEECIGLARERVIGKTFHELLPEGQSGAYHLRDQELFAHPGIQVYEAEIPCATGCRRDVVFYKATFAGADGVPAGIVGVMMDITERKDAEEKIRSLNKILAFRAAELAAANRELEAFSSSVSHDLRSPLTRIYSAGQLLKEMSAAMLDETGRSLLQTICDGCRDMEELIEALLTLSRVTSSTMNRTECNLSDLAGIIAAELQMTEPERRLEIAVEPGLADDGDPRLIRALLENLLANAWKYTRKVAEARIAFGSADIDGERVYFVRDNGAGFDMEKSDRLFKPFQRLHDTGDFKGTGIGLATVRRIVERHGGRVWGVGEVGRGATFFFTLKEFSPGNGLPISRQ